MQIDNKNFAFAGTEFGGPVVELTEHTHFESCNLVLARVNRNGFVFTHEGCNVNGLYLDGVKQDDYVWTQDIYDEDGNVIGTEERS